MHMRVRPTDLWFRLDMLSILKTPRVLYSISRLPTDLGRTAASLSRRLRRHRNGSTLVLRRPSALNVVVFKHTATGEAVGLGAEAHAVLLERQVRAARNRMVDVPQCRIGSAHDV